MPWFCLFFSKSFSIGIACLSSTSYPNQLFLTSFSLILFLSLILPVGFALRLGKFWPYSLWIWVSCMAWMFFAIFVFYLVSSCIFSHNSCMVKLGSNTLIDKGMEGFCTLPLHLLQASQLTPYVSLAPAIKRERVLTISVVKHIWETTVILLQYKWT